MRQLTLENAPASPQLVEIPTPTTLQDGLPIRRGIPMPRHMVSQGEEGYRTPTVEDYERHHRASTQDDTQMDGTSSGGSHVHLAPQSPGFFDRHRFLEQLDWNERIRHYTWVRSTTFREYHYSFAPWHVHSRC